MMKRQEVIALRPREGRELVWSHSAHHWPHWVQEPEFQFHHRSIATSAIPSSSPCPALQPQDEGSPLLPLDVGQGDALLGDFEVDHGGRGEDIPLQGGRDGLLHSQGSAQGLHAHRAQIQGMATWGAGADTALGPCQNPLGEWRSPRPCCSSAQSWGIRVPSCLGNLAGFLFEPSGGWVGAV